MSCFHGHTFPVVNDVPVMLLEDVEGTHPYFEQTLATVAGKPQAVPPQHRTNQTIVDPFVQEEIVRSCGHLYSHLKGRLTRYPIPTPPLPPGAGRQLLDIGCNWGRWTVGAACLGYEVVGLDPSLEAVLAAVRVAGQLGVEAAFVVGDGRFLPFRDDAFDVAFSYSVLQHLEKSDARLCLGETSRVVRQNGLVLVQMPNRFGLRQLLNRARQRLHSDSDPFRVRYWSPRELQTTFGELIGPTSLGVDGFFSLNPQLADIDLMTRRNAAILQISNGLRRLATKMRWMTRFADSLYIKAINERRRRTVNTGRGALEAR